MTAATMLSKGFCNFFADVAMCDEHNRESKACRLGIAGEMHTGQGRNGNMGQAYG